MARSSPTRLLLPALAILMIAPAIAFVVLHAVTPSDGTRMDPATNYWRPDGVVLTPIQPQSSPLRAGDVLLAIEGQSLESWARKLMRPDLPRPEWEFGQTMVYTISREGGRQDVPIVLGRFPLWPVLAGQWGTYLTTSLFLLVMTFLYFKCPQEPVTRVFLIGAAAMSSSYAWGLGLQASDFVGAWGFWLHQVSTLPIYLLIWATFVHAVLIFPRPHALLSRRPWIVPAIYAAPFVIYAAYLPLAAATSVSTLEWLGRINQFPTWLALGYVALAGVLAVFGYRRLRDSTHRLQVRWVVFAAVLFSAAALGLGFIPEILSGAPLVGWDVISLISLLVPLALVIAVLRYRLFDIDVIINRTLVYVPLTALLAGGYAASIKLFQVFFVSATGDESDAAIILTTLILASAFTPVKNSVQAQVDRYYQEPHEPARQLRAFDGQVQGLIEALDPKQSVRRLLDLAVEASGASGGAVTLFQNGQRSVLYATPDWQGRGAVRVPLEWEGTRVGLLQLGPPRAGLTRPPLDPTLLKDSAQRVAHLVGLVRAGQPSPTRHPSRQPARPSRRRRTRS